MIHNKANMDFTGCIHIPSFPETRKTSWSFLSCPLILLLLLIWSELATANHQGKNTPPHVALLYPTVSKQHSGMFTQLIKGIKSVPGYHFVPYRVDSNTSPARLLKWSKKENIQAYIALGQTTYRLVKAMDTQLPLVAGGMVATPPGITGISLSGDPEAFFRQLQLLNPDSNRVFFIHSKKNNGWVVKRARQISTNYGIEFVPLQVDNIKQATLQYKIILKSLVPQTDAIWIPLDNVAPLHILLPEILKTSWNKHITVFSNNLMHARRGALFALYPDHYKQGRRLVALLQRKLVNNNASDALYPSVDLKTAVNIRTATHLNLRYNREMVKKFDQVYPAYR